MTNPINKNIILQPPSQLENHKATKDTLTKVPQGHRSEERFHVEPKDVCFYLTRKVLSIDDVYSGLSSAFKAPD